jgi:CheY-like chemotaxis protein
MDKETQSKIFDPFFTTKFTGRGLGLAAVLGIARGHKAAIEVYSDEGQGTTIDILFPTAANLPTTAVQETRQIEAFDDGGTILVIDDEEPIREAVKEILEMAGFNILTAKDGIDGLKIFQQEKDNLSLVILDLTMPRLNGEEVFLQMHHIKPEVPVILASGYNEDEVTIRFTGKGLAAFIQKPFNHAILLAKVKQVLHK